MWPVINCYWKWTGRWQWDKVWEAGGRAQVQYGSGHGTAAVVLPGFAINDSPIQIWPSCCFFVPSASRVRFQIRLKSRGGCATKMLRTEIIEMLNAIRKSTNVLCIDRKLRSFWVEWCSYHICRCSRTYILNNLIHQLHNVFSLRRTSRCTDSGSNHWLGIQVARARCQDARATAARMSLKAGTADSMHGNNGEHFTKTSCSKL